MPMVVRTDEYAAWFRKLRDGRAKAKILTRIDRLLDGNAGDVAPHRRGLSELRIHYGPGYRVYFASRGDTLILLLIGGDKDSQQRAIETRQAARTGVLTMAKVKTARAYDPAEFLDSPEVIAEYLTEALESDDEVVIAKAIGAVARAQGMGTVAETAGVSRENLYRALSGETRPEFETIRKVLGALGVQLVAKPRPA